MTKLTQYSHGAGCGCKLAPDVLDQILKDSLTSPDNKRLLVGNHSKDDAAVFDLENGQALISTTDFFMPIVDDAYTFGRIASANAISDVYAMGGRPILAIAILGWPINILPLELATRVIDGSRSMCIEAGIPLAGGHSIDSQEPIFGLAVNGLVNISNIKRNNTAKPGDYLFLTKPLGVGILTTAEKRGILQQKHQSVAAFQMMQLNIVGRALSALKGVNAMTDVTGFGLLGHLCEMCEGSNLSATLNFQSIPLIIEDLPTYIKQDSIPGGTKRNLTAYGKKISISKEQDFDLISAILADPQTSGGLLIAVEEGEISAFEQVMSDFNLRAFTKPIGKLHPKSEQLISVY